jgi:hypothetical protein
MQLVPDKNMSLFKFRELRNCMHLAFFFEIKDNAYNHIPAREIF